MWTTCQPVRLVARLALSFCDRKTSRPPAVPYPHAAPPWGGPIPTHWGLRWSPCPLRCTEGGDSFYYARLYTSRILFVVLRPIAFLFAGTKTDGHTDPSEGVGDGCSTREARATVPGVVLMSQFTRLFTQYTASRVCSSAVRRHCAEPP